MGLAKTVFVAIDKLFDHDQNKRKSTRFEDGVFWFWFQVPFLRPFRLVFINFPPSLGKIDALFNKFRNFKLKV